MLSKTVLTAIVSLIGLCGVLVWRVREGRTAVTARKILIPPMGMATGFSMFFVRAFRFSPAQSSSPGRCSPPQASAAKATPS